MIKQTLDMLVRYWVLIAFVGGLVGALWRWLVKTGKKRDVQLMERLDTLERIVTILTAGQQITLRQSIIDNHTKYTEREYITIHGLEHVEGLYASYTEHGGNSFVKELMSDIRALQVKGSATK